MNAADESDTSPAASVPGAEQIFPCSASQLPFWFMDALSPGDPACNIALRWELEGRIVAAELERAFAAIVARHEILRTSFVEGDDGPIQRVAPRAGFRLDLLDLTLAPEPERAVLELARREARRPFDLGAPPLLRATLAMVAPNRAFLLVTLHHIVFDAWSIAVLAREFGAFAEAIERGAPPQLPELALQYGDYCLWRRVCEASADFADDLRYWRGRLEGAPYFALAGDRRPEPGAARGGEIVMTQLSEEISGRLDAVGRSLNVTMFVFGCAALAALLARRSGKRDVVFATQSAGREELDLEPLIGPFINTLALRFDASGDPSFREMLARAGEVVGEAMRHSNVPFHTLVETLNPARDPDRPALASINFTLVFHDVIVRRTRHGGLFLAAHPSTSPGCLYDLNFFVSRWPEGWRISLEYDDGRFEAATARALIEALAETFDFALRRPDARLSEFPAPARAPQPSPAPAREATRTIDARFAQAAAAAGEAVAVVCGEASISYAELDRLSNRCARRLRALGVRPGDLVGLMSHRSIETVVAIVATLKAGAAYVPFDPAYPKAQIAFMLEDCGVALALAGRDCREAAPEACPFASLQDVLADAARESDAPLEPRNAPDSLAYVMYTSGSTGRPKGVMIPHRAVVRLVVGQRYAEFGPGETLLHAAPLAFDASTFEIWGALLNGGRLAIVAEARPSLDDIYEALARHRVTLAWFTAGLFNLLVDERLGGLRGLRRIIAGGETLSPDHVGRALAGLPETAIVNGYGPTENTTFTCAYEAPRRGSRARLGDGPLPIGTAIAGTEAVILDADLAPVRNGLPGQLCCCGEGVALGYLNRPELTREKFIPDPSDPTGRRRLYLTGDLAMRRADGEILFLGRADRQLKINGKRVEPGEIETALRTDPRVLDAVVERREELPTRPLVAYCRLASGVRSDADLSRAILARLREGLPDHMVPSALVTLDAFPLTPNGKVDRRALPTPAFEPAGATADERSGWSEAERLVAEIWGETLKRDASGLSDNFFDLGGHSMAATRIAAKASQRLGVKVPVAALFKAPTLRAYAVYLERLAPAQAADDPRIVEIETRGDGAPIVALNDPMLYYGVARALGGTRPLLAVAPFDPDRPQTLSPRSLEAIAADYVELIRKARPRGPYVLMGYCVAGVIAFEAARQLRASGESVPLVVAADSWAPGHVRSLAPWRRLAAEAAFRLHVLRRQLSLWRGGEMSLPEILASYRLVRKSRVLDLAVALRLLKSKPLGRDDGQDQWFLGHLDAARAAYRGAPAAGDLALLQSDLIITPFCEVAMGWSRLVEGRLTLRRIPGWHGDMFGEAGAREIAAALGPLLAAADAGVAAPPDAGPQAPRRAPQWSRLTPLLILIGAGFALAADAAS